MPLIKTLTISHFIQDLFALRMHTCVAVAISYFSTAAFPLLSASAELLVERADVMTNCINITTKC